MTSNQNIVNNKVVRLEKTKNFHVDHFSIRVHLDRSIEVAKKNDQSRRFRLCSNSTRRPTLEASMVGRPTSGNLSSSSILAPQIAY
jgi:hypothetical protein